jgi:hypothetical protein
MAQEGDIIEVMFKGLLELLGWVAKKLFQLTVWTVTQLFKLVGFLFALIVSIFKKKDDTSAEA